MTLALAAMFCWLWAARPAPAATQRATVNGQCNVVVLVGNDSHGTVVSNPRCTTQVNHITQIIKPPAQPEPKINEVIYTQFALAELTRLDVEWTFANPPQSVRDAAEAGDAIIDTELLRDDDLSRSPVSLLAEVKTGLALVEKFPAIVAVMLDGWDESKLYADASVAETLRKYRREQGDWVGDIGSPLRYAGPTYPILLPLNMRRDAALSLGNAADAPRYPADQAVDPELPYQKLMNQAFEAGVEVGPVALKFSWTYDRAALAKAVARDVHTPLTAGFPETFSIVIPHEPMNRSSYVDAVSINLGGPMAHDPLDDTPRDRGAWLRRSTLKIWVNGITGPHYEYDVTLGVDATHGLDQGAYGAPFPDYRFTTFNCRLKRLVMPVRKSLP